MYCPGLADESEAVHCGACDEQSVIVERHRCCFNGRALAGMWEHAVTASHVDQLRAWEVEIVPPVAKTLICGDYGSATIRSRVHPSTDVVAGGSGLGAMATVDSIVEAVHASLRQAGLLSSPKRRRLIRPGQ